MGGTRKSQIAETGNYGDDRERYAVKEVESNVSKGDAVGVLAYLEKFDIRWSLMNVGPEKGVHLDSAVQRAITLQRGYT